MAERTWDLLIWRQATDLIQRAERIQRNFLQIAEAGYYRSSYSRAPSWEPPVNVIETDESLWVISAVPGVSADRVEVRLENNELLITGTRPVPQCCQDGELKVWEIPLGRFERRVRVVGSKSPVVLCEVSLEQGLLIIQLRKQA